MRLILLPSRRKPTLNPKIGAFGMMAPQKRDIESFCLFQGFICPDQQLYDPTDPKSQMFHGATKSRIEAVSLSVTVLPVTTDGNIDVLGGPGCNGWVGET